jgi:hypothetical protein
MLTYFAWRICKAGSQKQQLRDCPENGQAAEKLKLFQLVEYK